MSVDFRMELWTLCGDLWPLKSPHWPPSSVCSHSCRSVQSGWPEEVWVLLVHQNSNKYPSMQHTPDKFKYFQTVKWSMITEARVLLLESKRLMNTRRELINSSRSVYVCVYVYVHAWGTQCCTQSAVMWSYQQQRLCSAFCLYVSDTWMQRLWKVPRLYTYSVSNQSEIPLRMSH